LTAQCLNTIGLALGMAGVVILFIWGPPQPDFIEGDVYRLWCKRQDLARYDVGRAAGGWAWAS
jgi:hypothetical protein